MVLLLLGAYVVVLRDRLPLESWHLAALDAEFTARDTARVRALADYLRQEEAVFAQLEEQVYRRVPAADPGIINRYAAGSLADPRQFRPD